MPYIQKAEIEDTKPSQPLSVHSYLGQVGDQRTSRFFGGGEGDCVIITLSLHAIVSPVTDSLRDFAGFVYVSLESPVNRQLNVAGVFCYSI